MRFILTLLASALAATTLVVAQSSKAADLYQEALHAEEVKGDLTEAIRLYRSIVDTFPSERRTAASAQLRLARAYERTGSAEAQSAYEKVVRDFADQPGSVDEARKRLSVLGAAAARLAALGAASTSGVSPVQRRVRSGVSRAYMSPVSHDGRYVTLPDPETGNLALLDLVTGDKRLLTRKGSYRESNEAAAGSVISREGTADEVGVPSQTDLHPHRARRDRDQPSRA